jgi:hypothetical protein
MNDLLAGGCVGGSSRRVGSRRGFFLRLCTANPFYAISAVLVFVGLRASFDVGAAVFPSWSLLAALAGYTLLLAGMAVLLVRYGNVWDDIRTLLLLVVLMFLVISVAFDEILSREPREGVACCLGGLVFSSALSEALLRGLRLRFPTRYRLPYHAMLALFFAYPAAISPWLQRPTDPALPWALFGFAPAAGLVALTLLPAVRSGPVYVRDNGSPWRWPLYPWVVFGTLGFGACARSYYLCLSAQYAGVPGYYENYFSTIFGPYFLVPIGLAVAVLMLEAGLARRNDLVRDLALMAPAGLVLLALVGHAPYPVYRKFLNGFTATVGGTPAFATLLASILFYAVAAVRRVPHAWDGLTAALLGLSLIGPDAIDLGDLGPVNPGPLAMAATLQLGLAIRGRSSARALAASGGLGMALMASGWTEALSPAWRLALGFHLAIVSAMAVGAAFDDTLARALRFFGALLLGLAAIQVALFGAPGHGPSVSPEVVRLYPVAVGVVAALYGWWFSCRIYRIVAALALMLGSIAVAWPFYGRLRRLVVGLDQITFGLLSFALAALTSLAKAGALQEWWSRLRKPRPRDVGL